MTIGAALGVIVAAGGPHPPPRGSDVLVRLQAVSGCLEPFGRVGALIRESWVGHWDVAVDVLDVSSVVVDHFDTNSSARTPPPGGRTAESTLPIPQHVPCPCRRMNRSVGSVKATE